MSTSLYYPIIGVEFFSMLVCAVLLTSTVFETAHSSRRQYVFYLMVLCNMLGLLFDGISWVMEGHVEWTPFAYVADVVSAMLSFVLIAVFTWYLATFLSEREEVDMRPFYLLYGYCALSVLITLGVALAGQLFVIEDGCCSEGSLYIVYIIANVFSLVFCFMVVTCYRKVLGVHDGVAAYLYVLFPTFCAVVNLFVPQWAFAYPAATLSLLVAYIMLQSDANNQLAFEGEVSRHFATHDDLTGLLNRRAYGDKLDELVNSEGAIGVIFADLNGLKYANDHFGHVAGDELLVRFSKLLMNLFHSDEVYRISGDEFVVLLADLSEDVFRQKAQELNRSLMVDGREIACAGAEYGSRAKVNELIGMAEARMYQEKEIFHAAHPELSR